MASGTMREFDLAPPVMQWLRGRGFTPYGEILWRGRSIDVVGLNPEVVIAVELKTGLTRHVLRQAHMNQLAAHFSWCAVGTRPRKLPDGPFRTLGIMSVIGDHVSVLRESELSPCVADGHIRAVRGVCFHKQPDGPAGLPCQTGIGVAQMVYDAMVAYRQANPKAKWRQIWEDVPNHYKHARSMQGAMCVVRDVRARRAR